MKKTLSMLFTAILAISLVCPAFATEGANEIYNEPEDTSQSDVGLGLDDSDQSNDGIQVLSVCDHSPGAGHTYHFEDNKDGYTHDRVCEDCNQSVDKNLPHIDINPENHHCDECDGKVKRSPVGCDHSSIKFEDNGNGTHDGTCQWCDTVLYDNEPHDDGGFDLLCNKCNADVTASPAPCTHTNTQWVDNKDRTHREVCSDCGEVVVASEPHVDEAPDDFKCDKCGGEFKLKPEDCVDHNHHTRYDDNGDGATHDYVCLDCDTLISDNEAHRDDDTDNLCDNCDAVLQSQGPVLIATVPLKLPIVMDLKDDGVTVPTNAKITNHVQTRGITVSAIKMTTAGGWEIRTMGDDFTAIANNTKALAMSFRGDCNATDGNFNLSAGNWNIAKNDSLNLNMTARVPIHTTLTTESNIATVSFTLTWAEAGADTVTSA